MCVGILWYTTDYRGCVCGTKCTPAGDSDSVGKLGERAIRAIAGGTLVTLCAHTCPTDMSFQSVCYNASERNELIVTDDKEDCADDRLFVSFFITILSSFFPRIQYILCSFVAVYRCIGLQECIPALSSKRRRQLKVYINV